ncbi:family 43 glycosylhydrolase [Roseateles microcysteis]|uniref:family 43 glycosylhydrolase n=1 Tax=Roseateles microcysteis TaxID=3119057 RepID=UPI002FE5728A
MRRLIQVGLLAAFACPSAAQISEGCATVLGNAYLRPCLDNARGIEGQRRADLGDGRYLNPILAGDRPDPSILKDGDDYWMVHSSFETYPGLTIWHSRDLVNWTPRVSALKDYIGSVWAPELTKHAGRYYLYVPAKKPGNNNIYVMSAASIDGPWTPPVPLGNDRIDPGHIVGEDGKRYLFVSGGGRLKLSDDGMKVEGPLEKVYEGWQYPPEWDVESYSQEGPKMMRRGGYFYMTLALGGTAGPPTSHMVVSARSRSIHGPWENSPYNPITRTVTAAEKWWSKGHATLVEGPKPGTWYMVLHGYENGFHTLGRQTLLQPIEWTADGWFKASNQDIGQPIAKPDGKSERPPHGLALSDDFKTDRFGLQWSFFAAGANERQRLSHGDGVMALSAKGKSPADSSPLSFITGDTAYRFEVDLDIDEAAQGGALLFYNDKLFAGVGINERGIVLYRYGQEIRTSAKPAGMGMKLRLRVTNQRHVMTIHSSADAGKTWHKFGTQMDVSGYHHNVAGGFMSLRPALFAAGQGQVRFSRLSYEALP